MSALKLGLALSLSLHAAALPIYLGVKAAGNGTPELRSFEVKLIALPSSSEKTQDAQRAQRGNAGSDMISHRASEGGATSAPLLDTTELAQSELDEPITIQPRTLSSASGGAADITPPAPQSRRRPAAAAAPQRSLAGQIDGGAVPLYAENPTPIYPRSAQLKNWQGTVIITVEVSAEGGVDNLWVKTSSGFAVLDRAALKAVATWRFKAAKLFNRTIASTVQVPVVFNLQ